MRARLTGLALALLAVSVVPVAGPGVAPAAATPAPLASACPTQDVPATAFTDTVGSVHRAAIDCLAWWEVTLGRTPTTFAPDMRISRGQIAAMLARLLETTDVSTGDAPSAGFRDTAGHRFEEEIDLLASLGVVRGVSAGRFAPDRSTTRAQMASLLVRTFERVYERPLPTGAVPFTDVHRGNVHHDAIGRLVAAEITAGATATTYRPSRSVGRDQMASFVMRSVARLVDQGEAVPPTTRPGADDPFTSRTRGAWVHLFDDTLKSRSSIRRMVRDLDEAGTNTIVAQVARRHDAYYDSSVLPRTPDPTLESGLDVLDELLDAAHARDIDVHAWISVAPSWHSVYDDIGATPGDLGTRVAWRTYDVNGHRSTYLDPGVPAVQQHVVDIVDELASDYDVDGIHLDYVRYQSAAHGYHPEALERFRAEADYRGTPSPGNTEWGRWRRAQTRTIISRARAAIRAADPDTELSAAVITWGHGPSEPTRDGFQGTLSQRRVLQDWDDWARDGLVDRLMPMNYYAADNADYPDAFATWQRYQRALSADTGVPVVSGIGAYLNRPAAVLDQVAAAMRTNDGAMVYSYQQATDDGSRDVWDRLAATRWSYPPVRP